ncbi:MAG TPA: PAS domain S-box protein [Opitutaceae bacterium]|nr:PAS domain S-box protein [Opitutaceae bacterium]
MPSRATAPRAADDARSLTGPTGSGKLGIWEWEVATGALSWSDSLFAIHGVTREGFTPTLPAYIGLVHPEDLPRVQEAIRRTLEDDAPYEIEFRIRRPDGAIAWVFTSATVQREGSRPVRMIGATLDTTARRAEESASRRLAAIVESADAAIMSKDLDGRITSWNEGAARLFGYSADEILGQPVALLIPPDRESEERAILDRLRRGERIEHFETVRRRKDGSAVDVALTISPIRDAAGRVIGASKIARDVGDRRAAVAALRESEERFRLLADHVPVGIFLSDEAGRCVFVNNAWRAMSGMDAESACGDGWARALHPDDRARVAADWQAAVRSGASSRAEFRFRQPDGRVVWIDGDAVPFRHSARFKGYLGSCVDITARRMAERQNQFLHELSERLGGLAAPAQIMEAAAAALGAHLGADRAVFFEADGNPDVGRVLREWQAPGQPPLGGRYPFGGVGRLVTRPHAQVADVRRDATACLHGDALAAVGIRAFAAATHWQDGRWNLSLAVTTGAPRAWDEAETDLIDRVLARAWSLVERAHKIQALRESEQLYRAIGESIQYGVWVCDASGRNIYASDSFLKLVGLTQEQCANFGWISALHPDEAGATAEAWRECARTGAAWEREHRVRGADGRWHPVLARGVPIRDADGRITRWVGINLDISSIKDAQETARQRMHVLERLNAVGTRLVAERDVRKLVQLVTDTGRDVSGAAFGAFFYHVNDQRGDEYTLYSLSGAPREAFERFPMPRATKLFGPTFRGDAPIRVADVLADPRYGHNAPHQGMPAGHLPVRSYLAVPVIARSGGVLGGLFFGHPEPGVFTPEAEAVVVALAAQAAIAIDNANLYAALQKELEEQRRAESLLRESEGRWRQVAEAMPNLVWTCRADGLCDYLSRQWVEYTGVPESDQLGDGWTEALHPEDRDSVLAAWARAVESGAPYDTECRVRRADGVYRWFKVRSMPVRDEAGRIARWYGSHTDIEELRRAERAVRESEQQLRLVADHAPIYLAHLDRDHRFKFVNQPYADRYGRAREDILGRHVAELTGEPAYGVFRAHIERALAGHRVEFEQEIPYATLGRAWVHVIYEPERDAEGAVVGLIAVIMDVSARKRAERELERARDEALAASRAKDDFLAALSHELRTPLSPVLLVASDSAADAALPREIRENFEMIRANISLEARLIDDLLDLTRVSRGMLLLERQPLELHRVLGDALANLRGDFEAKRLQLVVDLAAGRTRIAGDPVRLQQVFWNILRNAVKFTDGDGRVHVSSRNDGDRVQVRVADTGIGMSAGELARAFDAFVQGDHAAGKSAYGGLGLGLAISRRLVELHGGRITAESAGRGSGAAFTIDLPLAETVARNAEAGGGTHPGAESSGDETALVRVLLVEDHAATRETVARLLARRNYDVTAVGSAAEARLAATGQKFEVLVSDVGLPDGDGYELMMELRRAQPGLRGIAVSGYGMDEDLSRSRHAGFAAHLVKPVSISALDETLRRLLARPLPSSSPAAR